MANPRMPPSYYREENSVWMSSFMLGMFVRLFKGLNNLKVLRPLMFLMSGSCYSRLVTTTMKSSQFHVSLR